MVNFLAILLKLLAVNIISNVNCFDTSCFFGAGSIHSYMRPLRVLDFFHKTLNFHNGIDSVCLLQHTIFRRLPASRRLLRPPRLE